MLTMSMHLQCTREDFKEENFEVMFAGIVDQIARVDELHPTEEHDDIYVFIIWLKDLDDSDTFEAKLRENASPYTATVHRLTEGMFSVTEVM